jgi:glycosyltransferase involved in cell wall biosynthesis
MELKGLTLLITCFNAAAYLEKLQPILTNAMNLGAKVVMVDDGSTDETLTNLLSFQYEQSALQIIQSINLGSASARNLALNSCDSQYFIFLDCDDSLDIPTLSRIYESFKNTNKDLALGNFVTTPAGQVGAVPKEIKNIENQLDDIRDELFLNMGYWRYLYRTKFIKEKQIHFSPTFSELGSRYFILDDVYFLIWVLASKPSLFLEAKNYTFYKYFVPEMTPRRWKGYLRQVRYIPLATEIFLYKLNQVSSGLDYQWAEEKCLEFTMDSYHRLTLGLAIGGSKNLWKLLSRFGWSGQNITISIINILWQAGKNSAGSILTKFPLGKSMLKMISRA